MTRVIYQADPITRRRTHKAACAGQTVRSHAPAWSVPFVACHNGRYLARAEWGQPMQEGDTLVFAAVPEGPAAAVFSFFVADAAATWVGNYVGAELLGAGWTAVGAKAAYALTYGAAFLAGSSLLSAAIGTPSNPSSLQMQDASAASPTYTLSAQSNSARINQPIPDHYGQVERFPDLIAQPVSEYRTALDANGDQYLIQKMMLGQGDYQIDGVYIDDTPIANFADVTYGFVEPGDEFPEDVYSMVYTNPEIGNNTLETDSPVVTVAVPEGRTATRFDVDLVFPQGLFYSNSSGGLDAMEARIKIEVRPVGGSTWTALTGPSYSDWSSWSNTVYDGDSSSPSNTSTQEYQALGPTYDGEGGGPWYQHQTRTRTYYADQWRITGATNTAQRRTLSFTGLTAERYEMRVTRMDTRNTSARAGHVAQLVGCKAWLNTPAGYDPAHGNTTRLWVVMRASDQLNQLSARKLKVVATRKLPVWNGSAWSAPVATSAIAWAAANVLRASYGAALPDSKIALEQLLALDAIWSARGDRFDGVFDTRTTAWEALGKICTAGRAKPYRQGGRVCLARDGLDTTPVAMFTPANMVAGSFAMSYIMPSERTAETVKVRYNSAVTGKPAEASYTLASADPDKMAEVDLFGVTQPSQAADTARYLAQINRYRRRFAGFDTELDALILSPLDVVAVSHDLPRWGQHAYARSWAAGTLTLTLDRELDWSGSGTHYARVRAGSGEPSAAMAVTQGASAAELVFASDPGDAVLDIAGGFDVHVTFGPSTAREVLAKILSITPKDEYKSTVQVVIEDTRVHEGC